MLDLRCRPSTAGPQGLLYARATPWLLALFLALGPVLWLPGIPSEALRLSKWMLLGLVVSLVFVAASTIGRRPFPTGLLGPLGLAALLLLWIPGLVQADSLASAAVLVVDVGSKFALLWCFYCVAREGSIVWDVYRRAFGIIVILAAVALLNELHGLELWETDGRWLGTREEGGVWQDDSPWYGGFGARGSGWSIGLGLFLPLAVVAFSGRGERFAWGWRILGFSGAMAILISQVHASGRMGLMASLVVIAGLTMLPDGKRLVVVLVTAGLIGALSLCLERSCVDQLRVDDVLAAPTADDRESVDAPLEALGWLDAASSQRLPGYFVGIDHLAESPLHGHGFRQVRTVNVLSEETDVHNLWLRWAVGSGILAPLLLMAMAASVLRVARRLYRDHELSDSERAGVAASALVVATGLLISQVEPHIPFGPLAVAGIWWAAAGTLLGLADRHESNQAAAVRGAMDT